ncbi:MAG: hypothetical protein RR140_02690 [Clostridia bacterium]
MAIFEIELERGKKCGETVFKILHGYGSHGKGGIICLTIRKRLFEMQKKHLVNQIVFGNNWTLENSDAQKILLKDSSNILDEDLGHFNPGITIFTIN